ncbi:AAA family ATPase [Streptomyces albogriseolus]
MSEEVPIEGPVWDGLDFVYDVLPRVEGALNAVGYEVFTSVDPTIVQLRDAVAMALDRGYRVVHVVSHGDADPRGDTDRVDIVPSCTRFGIGTNVSDWVATAQKTRQPTLFLLDLCFSGRAARLPSLLRQSEADTFAWVIAASGGDESAFDGRFSRAVADVLGELSETGLGTDSTRPYVSFRLLARSITKRVRDMPGLPQAVVSTKTDAGYDEPELPFFPNPRYVHDPGRQARRRLAPPIRAFLDELEASDADHFTDHAGPYFTGRRRQLRLLARWLDGKGGPRLCVVTGSPGVGKSALLGALVSAAHPQLSEVASHIRSRLEADPASCPATNPFLAAVHARQRLVEEIVSSLARQLQLPAPADGWEAHTLVDAVAALETAPVLVLDALDEAQDGGRVASELLLPLARAQRPDGRPACRLLLGMRPWEVFTDLRSVAASSGGLIDLDTTDAEELRGDLTEYLTNSLSNLDAYRDYRRRNVLTSLARRAAARLADAANSNREWGAFIVASIFTRYLATLPPPTTTKEAAEFGATIPTSFPAVFELDLKSRPYADGARAVLRALSYAKGDGMPTALAFPLAAVLTAGTAEGEISDLLDSVLFYLRTSVDTDGTTLYRPFHKGLADHLIGFPSGTTTPGAERVLASLLTALPGSWDRTGTSRTWASAPPYLLRHAIQHAQDAGRAEELINDADFLVHAVPETLEAVLTSSESAAPAVEVYRTSAAVHRHMAPAARRDILTIDAARCNATELLRQLSLTLTEDDWRPRWATGSAVSNGLRDTVSGVEADTMLCTSVEGRPVAVVRSMRGLEVWDLTTRRKVGEPLVVRPNAMACMVFNGRPVIVTGDSSVLRMWDLITRNQIGEDVRMELSLNETVDHLACTVVDGRAIAITAGWKRIVHTWDLTSGQHLCRDNTIRFAPIEEARRFGYNVRSVVCTVLDGRPVAVTGGRDGKIRIWDLTKHKGAGSFRTGHNGGIEAIACAEVAGRVVAVTGGNDGTVQLWDLATRRRLGEPLTGHTGPVTSMACAKVKDIPIALTGGTDRTVRMWELGDALKPLGEPLTGHAGPVTAVGCTVSDRRPVAVTCGGDGTLRLWEFVARRRMGTPPLPGHVGIVTAVACTEVQGRPVAVTGDADGTIRLWDVATSSTIGGPLDHSHCRTLVPTVWRIAHSHGVGGIACTVMEGRPVAVTCNGATLRVWDLTTGRLAGETPSPKFFEDHVALACAEIDGRPIAITRREEGRVVLWDVTTCRKTGELQTGTLGAMATAVALTVVDNRLTAVVGGANGMVGAWDATTRRPMGEPISSHTGWISVITCAEVEGHLIAVTGSPDGTVQVSDLTTRQRLGASPTGHIGSVQAVACNVIDGRLTVAAGGAHGGVCVGDLNGNRPASMFETPASVNGISFASDGAMVVAMGHEVLVMERAGGGR